MEDKLEKLHATLIELKHELQSLDTMDEQTRQSLDEMLQEIEASLHQPGGIQGEHPSMSERLKDAAQGFEDSHPTLFGIVGRMIDGLGKLASDQLERVPRVGPGAERDRAHDVASLKRRSRSARGTYRYLEITHDRRGRAALRADCRHRLWHGPGGRGRHGPCQNPGQPLRELHGAGSAADAHWFRRFAEDEDIRLCVVGLPVHLSGQEMPNRPSEAVRPVAARNHWTRGGFL